MTRLLAYHDDPAIKAKYLARVDAHRLADQIVQGTGYNGLVGCAVGCTLDAYNHSRYPIELGIPEELGYLEDRLFELIPRTDRPTWSWWPTRFLEAIRPGADLANIWYQWAHWMLVDERWGVIRRAGDRADARAAIEHVAGLYARWQSVITPEWVAAAAQAASAARGSGTQAARAARAAAHAAWASAAQAMWGTAEAAWAWVATGLGWAWGSAARAKLLELLAAC